MSRRGGRRPWAFEAHWAAPAWPPASTPKRVDPSMVNSFARFGWSRPGSVVVIREILSRGLRFSDWGGSSPVVAALVGRHRCTAIKMRSACSMVAVDCTAKPRRSPWWRASQ